MIAAALLALVGTFEAGDGTRSPAEVVEVRLDSLRPTQAVLGKDQIYRDLAKYRDDPQTLVEDLREDEGRGKNGSDPVGTHRDQMKSVVLGPGGVPYLTDGHHSLCAYHAMGVERISVVLQADLSRDEAGNPRLAAGFWKEMEQRGWVWLEDELGERIEPSTLPTALSMDLFRDDVFRSLAYFVRRIGYDKPERLGRPAVPFLEFHWARYFRERMDLGSYDLKTRSGYLDAIHRAIELTREADERAFEGTPFTPADLGRTDEVDEKRRKKLPRKVDELLRGRTPKRSSG